MKGKQHAIQREEKEEDTRRKVKAEEVERQRPKQVEGNFDRQEKKHAKSEGDQDTRRKAAVHEGGENGRDRGGRPPDRKEGPAEAPANGRGFKGKSILNTHNLGRTRDARNKPR